jgi:outer membrane protein OmpA-like peptidoglycan-associated protein
MHLLDLALGRGTPLVLALAIGSWLALPARSPDPGRVVVTDSETVVLDVVEFDAGTATLRSSSQPILDAVAATLLGNPSIELVEVQSHMSRIGDHDVNLALSNRRAQVVAAYLVNAGVPSSRLVARGYGDAQPIDPAIPANNERMSFLILARSPDLDP